MPRPTFRPAVLPLLAALGISLLGTAFHGWLYLRIQQKQQYVRGSVFTLKLLDGLVFDLIDLQDSQRGLTIIDDPSIRSFYADARARLGKKLQSLDSTDLALESHAVARTLSLLRERLLFADRVVTLAAKDRGSARDLIHSRVGLRATAEIRASLEPMSDQLAAQILAETQWIEQRAQLARISAITLGLADVLLLLMAAYQLRLSHRERDTALSAARQSETAFRHLSVALRDTQERERGVLARELHDELGQSLTAIKLALTSVRAVDSRSLDDLSVATELCDEAIQSTRRISSDLRPPMIENVGLISSLAWYLERFRKRVPFQLTYTLPESEPDLALDAKLAFFRIAQEALTNVVRHARARRAELSLTTDDDAVCLSVSDDGAGMHVDPSPVSHSLGLLGMRERARLIGAQLNIKSEPGSGVRIRLVLPVRVPV